MDRYSIIKKKNPREIILLRGTGCRWRKCTFCDYYLDGSVDIEKNFRLNSHVLNQVTGEYGVLEVINSGSFSDLDEQTIQQIEQTCKSKGITALHVEFHWIDRAEIQGIRKHFFGQGINLTVKMGVETFDINYREHTMKKGMGSAAPEEIAGFADEVCLLFGLEGQTEASMRQDIKIGLAFFKRVCINIMTENTAELKPYAPVIRLFIEKLYPDCIDNPRLDVLMENTDFGVGGNENEQ